MTRTLLAATALLSSIILSPGAGAAADEFIVRARIVPELKAVYGEVESRTVVPARARIGGTIRQIMVSEGAEVKEGELVGRVVDDKNAFELSAADARIAALESQLANARTELERAQQLLSRGIAPQNRLDLAKTQFDVTASQVTAAEADKAVIVQRMREGDILAPASGRVLTVPVTLGSVMLAGDQIARIATGQYYLRLSLPERHASEIRQGDTVVIGERGLTPARNGSSPSLRHGSIAKVYPEIVNGRVIADVEVAGLGDYFVNERTLVWIPVGKRSVLDVPPAAVTTRHGVDYLRIRTGDGALDVAVIVGERLDDGDGARVEILTGIHEGDRVLLPEAGK